MSSFYSSQKVLNVFISYALEYDEIVEVMVPLFEYSKINVYCFSQRPNLLGQNVMNAITEAINECDCFLLIWGEHSVNSPWVKREIDLLNSYYNDEKVIIAIIENEDVLEELPQTFKNHQYARTIQPDIEDLDDDFDNYWTSITNLIIISLLQLSRYKILQVNQLLEQEVISLRHEVKLLEQERQKEIKMLQGQNIDVDELIDLEFAFFEDEDEDEVRTDFEDEDEDEVRTDFEDEVRTDFNIFTSITRRIGHFFK